ncbi:hypothetical protein EVAR_29081_1 [Eumeta japonica]|uniref:BESS domain-containing protein n=1 Tax=Eumeta variegata TaxID=151549 RepID=A0A4C1VMH6_EUMVA|nr:hypothetical protein EVAR_29081_1 [Eumeta japonica]
MNEVDLIKEVEKRGRFCTTNPSAASTRPSYATTPGRRCQTHSTSPMLKDGDSNRTDRVKERDKNKTECKKRWRSLRDSFIKLQRTHGGKTRWPYLHAMRFLLPHVEPAPKKDHQTDESDQEDDSRHKLSYQELGISQDSQLDDDSPGAKKMKLLTDEEVPCQCRTDPDELFLLSCAPTLKRLNSRQNAVARLKIQQALYEAEFGCPGELPYVTPASDCDYENGEASIG